MRFIWLATLILFTACGPRNIDLTQGTGPQGRPVAKPNDPILGRFQIQFTPQDDNHVRSHSDDWMIFETARLSNFSDRRDLRLESESSRILLHSPRRVEVGSYKCVTPNSDSSLSDCRSVRVNLKNEWSSVHFEIPDFTFSFLFQQQKNCELSGQFEDESNPSIWARGRLQSFNSLAADPAIYSANLSFSQQFAFSLQADRAFADETTPITDFKAFFIPGPWIDASLQFPVRTATGIKIHLRDLRDRPVYFEKGEEENSYTTDLTFIEEATSLRKFAKVWITCHEPIFGRLPL